MYGELMSCVEEMQGGLSSCRRPGDGCLVSRTWSISESPWLEEKKSLAEPRPNFLAK